MWLVSMSALICVGHLAQIMADGCRSPTHNCLVKAVYIIQLFWLYVSTDDPLNSNFMVFYLPTQSSLTATYTGSKLYIFLFHIFFIAHLKNTIYLVWDTRNIFSNLVTYDMIYNAFSSSAGSAPLVFN